MARITYQHLIGEGQASKRYPREEKLDDPTRFLVEAKNFCNPQHYRRSTVLWCRSQYSGRFAKTLLDVAGIGRSFHRHRRLGLAPIKLKQYDTIWAPLYGEN